MSRRRAVVGGALNLLSNPGHELLVQRQNHDGQVRQGIARESDVAPVGTQGVIPDLADRDALGGIGPIKLESAPRLEDGIGPRRILGDVDEAVCEDGGRLVAFCDQISEPGLCFTLPLKLCSEGCTEFFPSVSTKSTFSRVSRIAQVSTAMRSSR